MTDGTQSQTAEQKENSNSEKPWLYKKWQSWNPSWRPKGSISLKTYLKNKFDTMTPEEREEFFEWMNKIDLWRMVEWMPHATQDITSNGETLQPVLVKFIDGNESHRDTSGV